MLWKRTKKVEVEEEKKHCTSDKIYFYNLYLEFLENAIVLCRILIKSISLEHDCVEFRKNQETIDEAL